MEESATLVGMCNNSSLYNPVKRNERTKTRRNKVLERCWQNGVLTEKQYKELIVKPLDVSKFKTTTHNDGIGTYFRSTLAAETKKLLKEKGVTKPDGTIYDVYRDGLKIYTTIDVEMQQTAEESMREHMAALQAKYFRIWRGRDPWLYKEEETTDDQIRGRLASLDAHIRESDRYQLLRSRYLDDVLDVIEKEVDGLQILDSDIINMLRQERQGTFLETMLKTNSISQKRVDIYRKIMKDDNWLLLRKQWNGLQNVIKTDFNTPTKMKVFAYNLTGEKDTTMTPLDSVRYHRMHLQLGALGIEPTTGQVKFWVGGIGHKYFQYDHVKSDRQVGSTFKPFVYATAIYNGFSPCTQVTDVAQTIGVNEGSFGLTQSWTPKNSGGYSGSTFTLWEALKESKNTVSVNLMKKIGSTQPVREIVANMGIDVDAKVMNNLRVPKSPSICLGSADLTVYEMAGAYSTFANKGKFIKPLYIRKITDKSGKVLFRDIPEKHDALPENVSYVMLQMLKYNVRTAKGIKGLKSEIGGKTGTTNDYRDGWFMGVTPNLVVGTWVGGEDQWIHFLTIEDGQGSAMARPFFAKFMAKIESSKTANFNTEAKFVKPAGDLGITMNCGDYYDSGNSRNTEGSSPASGIPADQFQDEEQGATKPAAAPAKPPLPNSPKSPTTPKPAADKNKPDDGFEGH